MHKKKFILLSIALLIIIIISVLIILGQSCTEVSLIRKFTATSSVASKVTYLEDPEVEDQNLRLIIFADMSHSMIRKPCSQDIDADKGEYDVEGEERLCSDIDGIDVDYLRLRIMKKWFNELNQKVPDLSRLKILIVPFTGGKSERMRDLQLLDEKMGFINLESAKIYTEDLITQQNDVIDFFNKRDSSAERPGYMGTSVPAGRLGKLNKILLDEITLLEENKQLDNSSFHVIYMSDGVPKPTVEHVKKTINEIWKYKQIALGEGQGTQGFEYCVDQCKNYLDKILVPQYSDQNINLFSLNNDIDQLGCNDDCLKAIAAYDREDLFGYHNILNDIINNWGDFYLNSPYEIIRAVDEIYNTFLTYDEASFKFSFILINPDKITEEEKNESKNWIKKGSKSFHINTKFYQLEDENFNLNLFSQLKASSSFEINQFFVFNLNARVNHFSKMDVDSDGDGLFDFEEEKLSQFNPQIARSNSFCLDIITKNYNCLQAGCDPLLDQDGDGLNECEEKTLGTNPFDFDTDNDSIPDGIEIIYRFNPLLNDKKNDQNGDGMPNFQNLKAGLMPFAALSNIDNEFKIISRFNFLNFKSKQNVFNQNILVAGYDVQVSNLPFNPSKEAKDSLTLYFSKRKENYFSPLFSLISGDHPEGKNRVVFLVKVHNKNNPNSIYWLAHEVSLSSANQEILIDFSDFQYLKVREMSWNVD